MDEVYRGYRIAVKLVDGIWTARIYTVRGPLVALRAKATEAEGEAICVARGRQEIDRYLNYLSRPIE